MRKESLRFLGAFIALVAVCACLFISCGPNVNYIKRVQSLEENVSSPTTIEELTDAIEKYQDRVEDIIQADAQTGIWWKILATIYMDQNMYGKALEAFRKAVAYYPANQNLYYWIGVCAGYMSKSSLDFDAVGENPKHKEYLALSESAYKRALELEPTYARALYGLGVLYAFELDQGDKAIPLLEKLLTIDTKNIDAMFVLARAYYMNYDFQAAVDVYDNIIKLSSSDTNKAEAEANKKVVLNALYSE